MCIVFTIWFKAEPCSLVQLASSRSKLHSHLQFSLEHSYAKVLQWFSRTCRYLYLIRLYDFRRKNKNDTSSVSKQRKNSFYKNTDLIFRLLWYVLLYMIHETVKPVMLWHVLNNCFLFLYHLKAFIPVIVKLNFHQSLLQSSVSHDLSEIIVICSRNMPHFNKNSAVSYFLWTHINVFTVTFS